MFKEEKNPTQLSETDVNNKNLNLNWTRWTKSFI